MTITNLQPESIQPPILNTEQLEELLMLGATDYVEVRNDVMECVPTHIRLIRKAIQDGNAKQLRTEAHSLHGVVAILGAETIIQKLNALRQQELPEPTNAEAIQTQFETLWQQTLIAIQQWEKAKPELAT